MLIQTLFESKLVNLSKFTYLNLLLNRKSSFKFNHLSIFTFPICFSKSLPRQTRKSVARIALTVSSSSFICWAINEVSNLISEKYSWNEDSLIQNEKIRYYFYETLQYKLRTRTCIPDSSFWVRSLPTSDTAGTEPPSFPLLLQK